MAPHDGHREKMRQRFRNEGLNHFTEHEALELLLFFTIPRKDTNLTAHALIDRYGSLSGVLAAPLEDLERVPGIGFNAAVLLKLVPAICSKARLEELKRGELLLDSTSAAGQYLLELFANERREVVYQLGVNQRGKLLFCKKLGEGNVASVALDIRTIIENAIFNYASGIILAHNHPSGLAIASEDDYVTTIQLKEALQAVKLNLLDHFIVAGDTYMSMKDQNLL